MKTEEYYQGDREEGKGSKKVNEDGWGMKTSSTSSHLYHVLQYK
jgi:hypothetical protein